MILRMDNMSNFYSKDLVFSIIILGRKSSELSLGIFNRFILL